MITKLDKLIYRKEISDNRVIVGEVSQKKKSNLALLCLFKGLLIFIASYCSICGLLDAFEIPYIKLVIFGFLLFISLYVAFLYFNKVIFYVFYIVLFLVFTVELARYYTPANSGFQAAINMIFKEYSDYFALSSLREGYEAVANRYYSVTVAAVFLGAFTAILLNVTISGYMNAFETALVTFPYIEIAFFIHKMPPAIYIVGLLFVYTTVLLLQFSKHSRMQVKSRRTHEFIRYKRKKEDTYAYQADARIFIFSSAFSLIFSLIITVVLIAPLNLPVSKIAGNEIHRQTQEYVKMFIQSGYTAFFDRYSSKGGIAGGKLGGVSQIRPDFETDLEVTFVPINFDTVYLKGFTGSKYVASGWYPDSYDYVKKENTREYNFNNTAKMHVENLDAFDYTFYPYFSSTDNVKYETGNKFKYDIVYSPALTVNDYKTEAEDELLKDEKYYKYVYETCLEVPEQLEETLDATLENVKEVENDNVNDYRLSSARAIYAYFSENFKYTMSPGSTPVRRDYVEYFLNTQQRGFCSHFASATVLLLREQGIPARYCEGYCIPISLVSDEAKLTEYDYNEWYSGSNITNTESVVTVPINDSYAHAWVEIYLEGYGFVPFEATIPSTEDERNQIGFFNFNFLSALTSNTLGENLSDVTGENAVNSNLNFESFFNIFDFNTATVKTTLLRILAVFIVLPLLFFLIRFLAIRIKLYKYKKNNDEYHLVMYEYSRLSAMLKRKKFLTKKNPLPSDVKKAYDLYITYHNNRHRKKIVKDTDKLFEYYERIMYS